MKNLSFCILIAILILLLFFVYGCGTRKTEVVKTENVKSNISIENTYSTGSKIVFMDVFTAKPIDALKPMWIDGKQYKNAIISNDKSKKTENWYYITKKYFITKTITVTKTKNTDKTDNTILWVLIAFIVCLFVFLWFYLPKLKTT